MGILNFVASPKREGWGVQTNDKISSIFWSSGTDTRGVQLMLELILIDFAIN